MIRNFSYWTNFKRKSKSLASTTGTMARAVYHDPRVVRHWASDLGDSVRHGFKWVRNGFRLFLKNLIVSRQLVWKSAMGHPLSLRESKLLVRTTSDLFKLVPFSLFIIIPFAELALPIFLRIFPKMLPSTFSDRSLDPSVLARQSKARNELSRWFSETVDHRHPETLEEIVDLAKENNYFELENMDLVSLQQMCRILGIEPFGFKPHVLVQLRHYLSGVQKEDRRILWEGVDTLTLYELQEALVARGMSVSDNVAEMRHDLEQWLQLSSHREVPISLVLFARSILHAKKSEEISPPAEDLFEETAERQKERADDVERRLEQLEGQLEDQAPEEGERDDLLDRVSKLEEEIEILEEIIKITTKEPLDSELAKRVKELNERRRTVRLSIDDHRFYP